MESWAFCSACDRWFYSPRNNAAWPETHLCGVQPEAIADREPEVRIQGLCPKCRQWFDCDNWFDQALPQPCCPGCGLGPIRLQYQPAQGRIATIELAPSELWIG